MSELRSADGPEDAHHLKRDGYLEQLQSNLATALALATYLCSHAIRDELDHRAPLTAVAVAELIEPIAQAVQGAEQLRMLYELQDRERRPPEPVLLSEREQFAVQALLDVTRDQPPGIMRRASDPPSTCVTCLTPITELKGHGMTIDASGHCDRCRREPPCQ